jgi:hypothetical protein
VSGSELNTDVQFNPSSLKVAFSNQVKTDDNNGGSAIQFVGKGSSKLSVELVFDVAGPNGEGTGDVRDETLKIAAFMEPTEEEGEGDEVRYKVPGVRFSWGTFRFDGVITSMNETLELWSEDGRPLRALVSISMSQQGIYTERNPSSSNATEQPPGAGKPAGTTPRKPAKEGDSVQSMAQRAGRGNDWKPIAQQNGIENPRNLPPGTLLDLKAKRRNTRIL